MLRWFERLEVAGLEPLGLAHRLGQRATYPHVERLAAAGLVARIYDRDGSLVAITLAGRRAARPDVFDGRPPRGGLVRNALSAHARAISWMAARATLRGQRWISEREMRTAPAWSVPVLWTSRRTHRPDLGLLLGDTRAAVEVELTAKSPSRLRAILHGYVAQSHAGRLAAVFYVCDDRSVARGVARAARHVGMSKRNFRLLLLEDVQRHVRELAASREERLEA